MIVISFHNDYIEAVFSGACQTAPKKHSPGMYLAARANQRSNAEHPALQAKTSKM